MITFRDIQRGESSVDVAYVGNDAIVDLVDETSQIDFLKEREMM